MRGFFSGLSQGIYAGVIAILSDRGKAFERRVTDICRYCEASIAEPGMMSVHIEFQNHSNSDSPDGEDIPINKPDNGGAVFLVSHRYEYSDNRSIHISMSTMEPAFKIARGGLFTRHFRAELALFCDTLTRLLAYAANQDETIQEQCEIAERADTPVKIRREKNEISVTAETIRTEEALKSKFAHMLHDGIGQHLAMIKLHLRKLKSETVFHGHDREVDRLTDLVDEAIANTRSLTWEFTPPVLNDIGLKAAMNELCGKLSRDYGIRINLEEYGKPAKPVLESRNTAWWAFRELLLNVLKHAKPRKIAVKLGWSDYRFSVTVTDFGKGFMRKGTGEPEGQKKDGGFGLRAIRERITALGGTISINSQLFKGTEVSFALPLDIGRGPQKSPPDEGAANE